ncbi:MAG: undecaprenyl-diphosphate phosphatase [Syntrophomonadaceae bacterium]|nr:undecaprenyl-diphosphate phosphatase [Syntrophomonadaceae bacterium]
MSIWQALILGAIQGLTEILPISSSGHSILLRDVLGMPQPAAEVEIFIRLGVLIAVIAVFSQDIKYIIKKPLNKLTYLIIIGCIPFALVGIILQFYYIKAFSSLFTVGVGFLISGAVLKIAEYFSDRDFGLKYIGETSYRDALSIGILQILSFIPGTSRSGLAIAGGLLAGMEKEYAARYSFLLSVPIILGAGVMETVSVVNRGINQAMIVPGLIGAATAAVFSFLALKIVVALISQGKISVFSYYSWAMALVVMAVYFYN